MPTPVSDPQETIIDLRCDADPRKLFGRLRRDGEAPSYTDDGLLIEIACRECRSALPDPEGKRVLHRFNVMGDLVETVVV